MSGRVSHWAQTSHFLTQCVRVSKIHQEKDDQFSTGPRVRFDVKQPTAMCLLNATWGREQEHSWRQCSGPGPVTGCSMIMLSKTQNNSPNACVTSGKCKNLNNYGTWQWRSPWRWQVLLEVLLWSGQTQIFPGLDVRQNGYEQCGEGWQMSVCCLFVFLGTKRGQLTAEPLLCAAAVWPAGMCRGGCQSEMLSCIWIKLPRHHLKTGPIW